MDIHPLLVHFPIALILVAALADLIGWFTRRQAWTRPAAVLFAVGALLAIPTAYTGDIAADRARGIAGIPADLDRHEDLAGYATWLAVALAVARVHLVTRKRFEGARQGLWICGALVAAALIAASGYTGGMLVYEHGAGTRSARQATGPADDAGGEPGTRPNAGITEFKTGAD